MLQKEKGRHSSHAVLAETAVEVTMDGGTPCAPTMKTWSTLGRDSLAGKPLVDDRPGVELPAMCECSEFVHASTHILDLVALAERRHSIVVSSSVYARIKELKNVKRDSEAEFSVK